MLSEAFNDSVKDVRSIDVSVEQPVDLSATETSKETQDFENREKEIAQGRTIAAQMGVESGFEGGMETGAEKQIKISKKQEKEDKKRKADFYFYARLQDLKERLIELNKEYAEALQLWLIAVQTLEKLRNEQDQLNKDLRRIEKIEEKFEETNELDGEELRETLEDFDVELTGNETEAELYDILMEVKEEKLERKEDLDAEIGKAEKDEEIKRENKNKKKEELDKIKNEIKNKLGSDEYKALSAPEKEELQKEIAKSENLVAIEGSDLSIEAKVEAVGAEISVKEEPKEEKTQQVRNGFASLMGELTQPKDPVDAENTLKPPTNEI